MKLKDYHDNLLNKKKAILDEVSPPDVIYEETQTGPQEEPMLFEYHLDLDVWMEYHRQKKEQ